MQSLKRPKTTIQKLATKPAPKEIGTFDDLLNLDPSKVKRIAVEQPRPTFLGIIGRTNKVQ